MNRLKRQLYTRRKLNTFVFTILLIITGLYISSFFIATQFVTSVIFLIGMYPIVNVLT